MSQPTIRRLTKAEAQARNRRPEASITKANVKALLTRILQNQPSLQQIQPNDSTASNNLLISSEEVELTAEQMLIIGKIKAGESVVVTGGAGQRHLTFTPCFSDILPFQVRASHALAATSSKRWRIFTPTAFWLWHQQVYMPIRSFDLTSLFFTGMTSLLVHGATIHSTFGLGLGNVTAPVAVSNLNPERSIRIVKARALIIDESESIFALYL
jgi:hypothetical protein